MARAETAAGQAADPEAAIEAARPAAGDPDPARANEADAVPRLERVKPDPVRIGAMLAEIGRIGADPDGPGVSRLGFTQSERAAHDLVGRWLRELGLTVRVDAIGNTIAERAGAGPGAASGGDAGPVIGGAGSAASATPDELPAIAVGSHLDSVPRGGRFDGIVGVVGAVELARVLAANDVRLRHPLRIVIFAGEEGARFGEPCIGSKAVSGHLADRDLGRMLDADGTSLEAALQAIGFDPRSIGQARWRPAEWAAFLELHIEQARTLEASNTPIGLVETVSGSTRLRLEIEGRADHSGGTPMDARADALTAAAEVVLAAESAAREPRNRGARLTVGRLEVHPNSITTIPGRVRFTLDVRDVDSDRQRRLAVEMVRRARVLCERRKVTISAELIADTSPSVLPMWLRNVTSEVCGDLGIRFRVMTSGAGHDAQVVNSIVPAGMVFVPSKDGLSHVPEEWTSASDVARGVEVLAATVTRLDDLLVSLRSAGAAAALTT